MPHRRCPDCGLRFYAVAGHSMQVVCPECETVLRAVRATGDVNTWLARRIIAELPVRSATPNTVTPASDLAGIDG